jgi:hypothetical protein
MSPLSPPCPPLPLRVRGGNNLSGPRRIGAKKTIGLSAAFVLVAMFFVDARGVAQQASTASHRYAPKFERAVQPGGPGPNRLAIDDWMVEHGQPFTVQASGTVGDETVPHQIALGGLRDLRLFDASNREVPYLLVPPEPAAYRWSMGQMLPLVETKTTSGFEVMLPRPLVIDRLRLGGLPPRFLKRATLEGSGDREHWTALAPQATVFDLPDDQLQQLVIAFPASELRYLRLTWDDRNSGKLPLPQTVGVREAMASPPAEPLRVALEIEKRPSEPGKSRYRVKLPALYMPITHIEVDAREANILRRGRVIESYLSADRLEPRELGASTLRRASRAEDEATAANLRVPLNQAPLTWQMDLTIEDGSNPPLDLTGVFAVLAPLPWIYFESPDGAPLTARLGDRKAAAPSYDLEANRANASKIATVTASLGAPSASPLESASTAVEEAVPGSSASLVGAPIDISEFRYMRDVPAAAGAVPSAGAGASAGVTALSLDAAVLAHSRLIDLRLVDRDNRQHAYVLESRDEPLTIDLGHPLKPGTAPEWLADQLKNAPSGNRTIYRLQLPYEHLPSAKVTLTTGTRVFTRQISAFAEEEMTFSRDRAGARRLFSMAWSHADPNEPAPPLDFTIDPLDTRELVLMVDEGDNAPLPIASATMLLPTYRIRFLRTDAQQPLTLYYGDATLSAPRYDLALLKPYMLDAPASELTPGAERERTTASMTTAHIPFWAFWGVLIAAVLILLALIVRLLRAESAAETPSAGTPGA